MSFLSELFKPRKNANKIQFFGDTTSFFSHSAPKTEDNPLVRACVHTFAAHCSKLDFVVTGNARKDLQTMRKPNEKQTFSQFLYQIATLLSVENTAFILPEENRAGRIMGYLPARFLTAEIVDVSGQKFLTGTTEDGIEIVVELGRVGILTQHNIGVFGQSNDVLKTALKAVQ